MSGLLGTENKEPVGAAGVFMAALNVAWAVWPAIPARITSAVNLFAIALAGWYARRNSTPNVKVATTKKAA